MRSKRLALLCSSFTLLISKAPTQEPFVDPALLERLASVVREVPLHGSPRGEGRNENVRYALRERYKVELDRSFTFIPFLGSRAPRNVPFRWSTASIERSGERCVADTLSTVVHDDWSYRVEYEGWSERYDLRPEGLELGWRFETLPAGKGDLVIRGNVVTDAVAEPRGYRHEALTFEKRDGLPVIRFGEAYAFDAEGRTANLETAWDGTCVSIRVPAAWIENAAFPLIVDPLVSGISIQGGGLSGDLASVAVQSVETAFAYKIAIGFTKAFSATDHDAYGLLLRADLSDPRLVWTQTRASDSDRDVSVAYCGGADRYLFCTQRDFSRAEGDFAGVRLYLHDRDVPAANSGIEILHDGAPTASYTRPVLGGSNPFDSSQNRALLVFQHDETTQRSNTQHSEIFAAPIDVVNGSVLAAHRPGGHPVGNVYDRGQPTVSPVSGGGNDGWFIAWTEIDRSTGLADDFDLHGAMTDANGARLGSALLRDAGGSSHLVFPHVAGENGRYLLAWARTSSLQSFVGSRLETLRIDWPQNQTGPCFPHPQRTIEATASNDGYLQPTGLEVDRRHGTHWALAYTSGNLFGLPAQRSVKAARLGGSGAPLEIGAMPTIDPVDPALCFVYGSSRWLVVSGAMNSPTTLETAWLSHPSGSSWSYGVSGCGGNIQISSPMAGNLDFECSLTAGAGRAAVLILGLQPTAIPLTALGMPGCELGIDPTTWIATFGHVTDGTGRATQPLPLPDSPGFTGDFVLQWAFAAPGANALSLLASGSAIVRVR